MPVYHLHINGLVQGVGFRPTVQQLAIQMGIDGWVKNGSDGVHIICKTNLENAKAFYQQLLEQPPSNAIITQHLFELAQEDCAKGFHIVSSSREAHVNMMLTPDLAPCDHCRKTISESDNQRYLYAFTTCLQCGPRYSIINALPYDRVNTSMAQMQQCPSCLKEYDQVANTRHHSQTNSCKSCAIQMHLYNTNLEELPISQDEISEQLAIFLQKGKILAVKGVGGYLLICDAANKEAISSLRKRKHRPSKPFALLYADIEMAQADLSITATEISALKDKSAPIVLCRIKNFPENNLDLEGIAPGLARLGAMLPASPLLQLLANHFGKPLVATSGNLSGSPILFQDQKAKEWLLGIADYLLTYDREIQAPQDDSLIQFTSRGQKIILRRSRGLSPNFYPINFQQDTKNILAMGAELKSSFAIATGNQIFVSQFLGDQQSLESQMAFDDSLQQVSTLL
ncbi:MAG TPA: Sua5/YciO/YrdC/YwlC family protein, partial [Sediminibacterium sp.]|nr:Sua5/YciO/YrdC/YwlC family protein [Sediminibacterium sp.]